MCVLQPDRHAPSVAAAHVHDYRCGIARVHLDRGIAIFDQVQRHRYLELTPIDALVFLSTQLSLALACSGFLDKARSHRQLGIAESRRLAHAHTLAAALYFSLRTGWSARFDYESLRQESEELLGSRLITNN